jgi:dihydrofolate synthase/folylpolyglutamate synthase
LAGKHQRENAALAIAALRAAGVAIDNEAIAQGLANVEWPARFQRWDDRTIIDGAHNPAGAKVLAEICKEQIGEQPLTIVLAVLREKNIRDICRALAPIAARFILPRIRAERALPPTELAPYVSVTAPALPYSITPTVSAALESARTHPEPILNTGSLHFAGEALATLNGTPDALEDCAQ